MTTNLDAFAAQLFKEWRRVTDDRRAERVKPMRVTEALDHKIATDPEAAWPLVLGIVDRAATPAEVRQAATFALTPFLVTWAPEYGDKVAAEIRRNPKFAAAVAIHNETDIASQSDHPSHGIR